MDDVAREAGVSRALVSLVMRGSPKVSEKRRALVLEAAAKLGYLPNAAARSLAQNRSNTVGVVLNDLHNPFFADVIDGIHEVAVEHNYRLLLNTAWRQDEDERTAIESFMEYRVDAVIVVGPAAGAAVLEASKSIPLVSISGHVPGVDTVMNDDERGAELVVEHFVELGHTSIVHVDGGDGGGAAARRAGYVAAMLRLHLEPHVIRGEFTEESGISAANKLLTSKRLPTAVFVANDLAAVAFIEQIELAGLSVPGDVSVVGYDNSSLAGLRHIGLTTINQPKELMGQVAMQCALERLDTGRRAAVTHVLEPELIVRTTSGAAPTGPRSAALKPS